MTNPDNEHAEKLAAHLASLQAAGAIQMTPEEILAGETQAGVPRPSFLTDDEDDGTVHRVRVGRGAP